MNNFTANQRKQLAKKIRACKNKMFPEHGGGKKLAAMLDISPQLLTNWMGGTRLPSLVELAKLARIFNISIHELCSLPYSKRKSTAPDLIASLTKYHDKAHARGITAYAERKRLKSINSFINSELGNHI